MSGPLSPKGDITRRGFLKTAATGAAGLALMGWPVTKAEGFQKYPHWGKVIVLRDDAATEGPHINQKIIHSMLDEAIQKLTNGGGWRSFFPSYHPGEVVAIKINAIARMMTTHWEVIEAIVNGLLGIGIQPGDIIVWDRFASEMNAAKYVLRNEPSGVRVMGGDQLKDPYDRSKPIEIDGVVTYPSRILSQATYLINAPILKEHIEAGITFALKNHVGSVDNPKKVLHLPAEFGNLLHMYLGRGKPKHKGIALINAVTDIKNKTRLIVGDALFGIYQRGPRGSPQFTYNGLIVGTDPVATDHQARLIIDEERKKHGETPTNPSHIDEAVLLGLGAPINDIQVLSVHRKKRGVGNE